MRKALALLIVALAAPALSAGEFELTGYAGYTFPFYSQTFGYDPGPVSVPIPGVTVEQGGSFLLDASGGPAFAGALAFYATDSFGFELRYDHAEINVENMDSVYDVEVGLPGGLAPVTAHLDFTDGETRIDSLAPLSLNLKLRTGSPVRVGLSGGAGCLG